MNPLGGVAPTDGARGPREVGDETCYTPLFWIVTRVEKSGEVEQWNQASTVIFAEEGEAQKEKQKPCFFFFAKSRTVKKRFGISCC